MAPAEPRRFTPSHLRAEIRATSCINIHSHRSAAPRYDCSLSIGKLYDSPKCFHYEPFKQKYYRNFTSSVHLDSGNTDIMSHSSHLQTHLSCSDWSVVAQSSFPFAVMLEVRGSRFADFLNKSLQRRALVSQCCSCKPFPVYTESHRIQIPVIPEEQIQLVQTSPKLELSFYRVHPAGRRVKETAVPLE